MKVFILITLVLIAFVLSIIFKTGLALVAGLIIKKYFLNYWFSLFIAYSVLMFILCRQIEHIQKLEEEDANQKFNALIFLIFLYSCKAIFIFIYLEKWNV